MTKEIKNSSKQSGFTLIEVMIVLAILGILVSGIFFANEHLGDKAAIKNQRDILVEIVADLRLSYKGKATCNNLNNTRAIRLGVVPERSHDGTSTVYTTWTGGLINLICSDWVSNPYFRIQIAGSDENLCKDFLPLVVEGPDRIMIGPNIGSLTTIKQQAFFGAPGIQFDPTTAAALCADPGMIELWYPK